MAANPMMVAGAICGESGPEDPKWFVVTGFPCEKVFKSTQEAEKLLRGTIASKFISDEEIKLFAKRPCYPIGKMAILNRFHYKKVILLGDAAAPFPPVGQGINSALESAM